MRPRRGPARLYRRGCCSRRVPWRTCGRRTSSCGERCRRTTSWGGLRAAGRARPAHIIKFRPVGIERITESALQLTNRGREILQHDTLPSRSRAPLWPCCCRRRLLVVRTKGRVQSAGPREFRLKVIKNWCSWSPRRLMRRRVAIRLYEALRVAAKCGSPPARSPARSSGVASSRQAVASRESPAWFVPGDRPE